VIHGISPLIWRPLLVAAQTTIAELHAIVQTVFGWSGDAGDTASRLRVDAG
jgi:Plasmid pRiA4b ORF-3-like protein